MKKTLIAFLLTFTVCLNVLAADAPQSPLLKRGIQKYKQSNYTGSLEDMTKVLEYDPSNALAQYYSAITYVKFGQTELAKNFYNKVISLNTSEQLTKYAQMGIKCIDEPDKCPTNMTTGAQATGKIIESAAGKAETDVKKFIEQKKLDSVKEIINAGGKVPTTEIQEFREVPALNKKSELPTKDEVAKAIETLKKAGIENNYTNNTATNPYANPELLQTTMMMSALGGMNNNNMGGMSGMSGMGSMGGGQMNMLPLLMMQQGQNGNANIDPKVLQTMMMSSMMPNMSSFDSGSKQEDY